jgi:hypothetical protein
LKFEILSSFFAFPFSGELIRVFFPCEFESILPREGGSDEILDFPFFFEIHRALPRFRVFSNNFSAREQRAAPRTPRHAHIKVSRFTRCMYALKLPADVLLFRPPPRGFRPLQDISFPPCFSLPGRQLSPISRLHITAPSKHPSCYQPPPSSPSAQHTHTIA